MTDHQQNQIQIINQIEKQVRNNTLQFSTVDPVDDFEKDTRICLTSVHIPHQSLKNKIKEMIIDPLRLKFPEHYYYLNDSLHMTIKNIRVINDPPHFTEEDIQKAKEVFIKIIPRHTKFHVYFYRLFIFPMSLALFGTTDPELDNVVLDLDRALKIGGVPDDKAYVNSRYFFSNMTLVRFQKPITDELRKCIEDFLRSLMFDPYVVDSVTLLTCNAVFKKQTVIGTWQLQ